jgi:NDP-sugar pyrophosphorylase family protein
MRKISTAIILAGGFGTRLAPLTDTTPKPLLPVKGKPIIQYAIENLRKYGIKNIILSVGYRADEIKAYFKNGKELGVKISYCLEDQPLGTGGAIKLASKSLKEHFIVLNGDNLADFDYNKMLKAHDKNKATITIALYPVEDVTQFGIAELKGEKIVRFIEKPTLKDAPSNLNNAGAYVIEPVALGILPEGKSSIERDCFEKLCGKRGKVFAYEHSGQWFPTDDIERYKKANFKYSAA